MKVYIKIGGWANRRNGLLDSHGWKETVRDKKEKKRESEAFHPLYRFVYTSNIIFLLSLHATNSCVFQIKHCSERERERQINGKGEIARKRKSRNEKEWEIGIEITIIREREIEVETETGERERQIERQAERERELNRSFFALLAFSVDLCNFFSYFPIMMHHIHLRVNIILWKETYNSIEYDFLFRFICTSKRNSDFIAFSIYRGNACSRGRCRI